MPGLPGVADVGDVSGLPDVANRVRRRSPAGDAKCSTMGHLAHRHGLHEAVAARSRSGGERSGPATEPLGVRQPSLLLLLSSSLLLLLPAACPDSRATEWRTQADTHDRLARSGTTRPTATRRALSACAVSRNARPGFRGSAGERSRPPVGTRRAERKLVVCSNTSVDRQ